MRALQPPNHLGAKDGSTTAVMPVYSRILGQSGGLALLPGARQWPGTNLRRARQNFILNVIKIYNI